uniref:hypothetical protein n=1 Tax=Gluconobacter wancherniae TaxID=1307955 RepID=UPI002010F499|nr:hypothetical protein [Gluconobacter wancherniae]
MRRSSSAITILVIVDIDVKYLPKLRAANGERRKGFLYVAIDRCFRSVHLDAYNALDFVKAVKTDFPLRVTHILTDRSFCFTTDAL